MRTLLWVGLGGALGAMLRYGISLLPVRGSFPYPTLGTNLLGALLIGGLVGYASARGLTGGASLFLKTGFCGGFTTFSTFSLETLELVEGGRILQAGLYAAASLLLCLLGVYVGRACVLRLLGV